MFRFFLLSLLVTIVSAVHCEVTKPDTVMFIEGASVGRITCQEVELFDDMLNPNECTFVQDRTHNWKEDPCGCVDINTREPCTPPPPAAVAGCDLCPDAESIIGDPMRVVTLPGNYFNGNICGDIAETPLDLSDPTTCDMAKSAVGAFCKCLPPGTSLGSDVCIPQEISSLPGTNSCDPDDDSETCCVGECKFRLTHSTYVCTTKEAETPSAYSQPTSTSNFGGDESDGIVNKAPSESCAGSPAYGVCVNDDDCCGGLSCLGEPYNFCKPPSTGSKQGMKSSHGGGGAGGGGRKLAHKKTNNSKHHNDKKRRSTLTHKSKNLRQMRK